jgi:WD40 repeat protein
VTETSEATRRARVPDCPYVGLRNFTEDYAEYFFGRDEDRRRIIGNLRVARLTLLYAESGVGKSSVLRAGVMARLRELAGQNGSSGSVSREVPVLFSTWSGDPIRGLIDEIVAAASPFATEPVTVPSDLLADAIVAATDATSSDLLIILDQFEEYFSNPSRQGPGDAFADQLAECINRTDLHARFLISIREDAYAGLGDLLNSRIDNVYGNYLHLDYLDEPAARDSVVRPVERWNELVADGMPYEVEPALVDAIVTQVRLGEVAHGANHARNDDPPYDDPAYDGHDTRVETTYLQLVMKRLWDEEVRSSSHVLRLETLRRLGDAEHIIGTHLDTAMAELTGEQQHVAATMFRFLVTRTGMKIAISASDLADMSNMPEAELVGTLRRLASADLHILRSVVVPGDRDGPRYEIFHDALAQPIREWRNRHLLAKAQEEQLAEIERQGAQLIEARIQAGRERRRRVVLSGVSVVLVVLVVLLIAMFTLWRRSLDLSNRSESAELAAKALSTGSNPEGSLDLAEQAVAKYQTPEALLAARVAMAKPHVAAVFPQEIGDSASVQVVHNADGNLVAFGGSGGAWLWDRHTNTTREFEAADGTRFGRNTSLGTPVAFRFSAFSDSVLVVGHARALTYEVGQRGQPRGLLRPTPGGINAPPGSYLVSGAISPNGEEVVALSSGAQTIDVVDPTGRPLGTPAGVATAAIAADWSDDGRTLVALTNNGTMDVWTDNGGALTPQGKPIGGVTTYRFFEKGTMLATGFVGGVQVWNLPEMTPALPLLATNANDPVQEIANHSGSLSAVGFGGVVRTFDLNHPTKAPQQLVTGQQFQPRLGGAVSDLAFGNSPFLITNNSGSVTIWDTEAGVPIEKYDFSGQLFDAELRADGTYDFLQLSLVPRNTTDPTLVPRLRLWQGQTAGSLGPLKGGIAQTSFSRDDAHLIVVYYASRGWQVEVRTYPGLATAKNPMSPSLAGSASVLSSNIVVAADRGAKEVVTVTSPNVLNAAENRVQVWDPTSGSAREELYNSRYPFGATAAMDVTPDGRYVLIAGYDPGKGVGYTERIPVDGGAATTIDTRPLTGDSAVAVSDDNRFSVVGTADGAAVVYGPNGDNKTLRPIDYGSAATASISAVAISGTSRFVATGNADGTVVLWDRATGRIVRRFELRSEIKALTFTPKADYVIVKASNTPTEILAASGDTGANAVMLVDPVPEPWYEAAAYDPRHLLNSGDDTPGIVSTEGRYAVVYPCVACVPTSKLLKELQQRLDVREIGSG